MDRYTLSSEGNARFKRRKISANLGMETIDGYEVLECLLENGSATIEEIGEFTGLSREQVNNKLTNYIYWGYIEETTSQAIHYGKSK